MKNIFLLALIFVCGNLFAQTSAALNENTVVRDSAGVKQPYEVWQKLAKSGDYTLRRESGATEFVLHKLSPQEKVMLEERKKNRMITLPKPKSVDSFKENSTFNGERFTDINGSKFDLRKPDGKVYVINFWFINCPPCKTEMPILNKLVEKYKDNKDVVFLGIALDDKFALRDFLKTNPFNYNIISDGKTYSQKYEIKGYPTHIIVGKDGLVKFSTMGLAENTIYWIEKILAQQVTTSVDKTTSGR